VPVSGMKAGCPPTPHSIGDPQCAARMLLLTDMLMSCCAAGTNACLDTRPRAFALGGQVSAERSRCPTSMARRARDSVAPLRRSSAGRMPVRIGRLSTGVGRRQPVTIRKASLMAGSIRLLQLGCCCSSTPTGTGKPPPERDV